MVFKYDELQVKSQYNNYEATLNMVQRQVLLDQYAQLFESLRSLGESKKREDYDSEKLRQLTE